MKLKATITATVHVKPNESPNEASERVYDKLANICEDWLEGTMAPYIRLEYTIKDEIERNDRIGGKNKEILN